MTEFPDENPQLEHAADLRQASDLFMQRLDRLQDLETRKRELAPDESEFVRLAREIEDLSRALLWAGSQQVELAEEVHHEAKANDVAVDQSIRDTAPRRDAVSILAEWRAAERRLSAAEPGSDEERDARAETERLRDEYRRLTAPIPGDDASP
jgi:hypothetical protein